MFCQNCGTVLITGAKFCNACGYPVAPPTPAPEQPEQTAPILIEPAPEQPEQTAPILIEPAPEQPEQTAPILIEPAPEPPEPPAPILIEPAPEPPEPPAPILIEPAPDEFERSSQPVGAPILDLVASTVDGTAVAVAEPESGLQAVPYGDGTPILTGKKKRGKALLLLGILAAVLLVLGIGAAVWLMPLLSGDASYVYLTEDGELLGMNRLSEKAKATELDDENAWNVRFSADGKTLCFETQRGDLYGMPTAKIGKKEAIPEHITSGVGQWELLCDGKVVYIKGDQLQYFDGEKSEKLSSGVDYFSAGDRYAYYMERDNSGDSGTLYRIPLRADGQKEKLVSNIDTLLTPMDSECLVFTRLQGYSSYDIPLYEVYSRAPDGKEQKLVSDAESVYGPEVSGGQASFYYTTVQNEEHALYDFASDAMAASDANQREPYPEDFETYLTVDYFGYSDWETDWDAYYAAAESWYEVARRNEIRDDLRSESYLLSSYTLIRYQNGKETEIATDINYLSIEAAEDDIFLYHKIDRRVQPVADVSDLTYADEIIEHMQTESTLYQNVGGTESELPLDEDVEVGEIYVLNGTTAFLACYDGDGEDTMLLDYRVGADGLTLSGTVTDEYEYDATILHGSDGKDALYYFTDRNNTDDAGTLIRYLNGKKTTLVRDANGVYLSEDGSTCFALSDGRNGEYTLSRVQDGKEIQIADEVSSVTVLKDNRVAYIGDRDLYVWDGSKSQRLATDVSRFWSNDAAEMANLWCMQEY